MDHLNNSPAAPANQESPHDPDTVSPNPDNLSSNQLAVSANSEALAVGLAVVGSRPYQASDELVPSQGDRMSSQPLPRSAVGRQGRAVNSVEPRHGMELPAERPTLRGSVQDESLHRGRLSRSATPSRNTAPSRYQHLTMDELISLGDRYSSQPSVVQEVQAELARRSQLSRRRVVTARLVDRSTLIPTQHVRRPASNIEEAQAGGVSHRPAFNVEEAQAVLRQRLHVGMRPGSLAPPSLNNVPLAEQENIPSALALRLQENQEREDRENSVIDAFVRQHTLPAVHSVLERQLPPMPDRDPILPIQPLQQRLAIGLQGIPLNSVMVPTDTNRVDILTVLRPTGVASDMIAIPTSQTMNSELGPHMATQTGNESDPYFMPFNVVASTNTTQTCPFVIDSGHQIQPTSRDRGTDPILDESTRLPRKRTSSHIRGDDDEYIARKIAKLEDKYFDEHLLRTTAQDEANFQRSLLKIARDENKQLTSNIQELRRQIENDTANKKSVCNALVAQKLETDNLRIRYQREQRLTADLRNRLNFKHHEEMTAKARARLAQENNERLHEINVKLTTTMPHIEIANLNRKVNELEEVSRNQSLILELSNQACERELSKKQEIISGLESALKEKTDTVREIEMENTNLTESVEYLTQQEKELKSRVAQLENELHNMRSDNQALRANCNNSQRQLLIFEEILEAFDSYQELTFVVPYNALLKIMLVRLEARDPFFTYFNMERLTFGDQIRMTNSFANLWTEVISLGDVLYPEYATNPLRDEDGNIIPLANVADMKRWLIQEGSFDPVGIINRLFENYYRLKSTAQQHIALQEANEVLVPERHPSFPYEAFGNPHNAVIDHLVEINRLRGELELEALEEEALENADPFRSGDEMEIAFEEIRNSYNAQMRNIDAIMDAHAEAEAEDEDQE